LPHEASFHPDGPFGRRLYPARRECRAAQGHAISQERQGFAAKARSTALAVERGTLVGWELEPELGGSGLRYSFDIRVGHSVREVGIDAITGKVLEDSIDTGND